MIPPSFLTAIETLLTESIEAFNNHRNVNTLCEQLKDEFFAIVETLLTPVIEKVVCDGDLLPELKVGAGKMGLHFNGYRPTSIRLLTQVRQIFSREAVFGSLFASKSG